MVGDRDIEEDLAEHWSDIPKEQRREIVAGAKSRLWWRQFFARMEWMKGFATILLTIAALWTLMGEAFAEWLKR